MAEWWEEDETVEPAAAPVADFGAEDEVIPDEEPPPPAAPAEPTVGEQALGAGEAALAIGAGALAEPVAGIAGLATAAFEGAEAGAEMVDEVREWLSYTPQTERGKEYVETVAGVMQPVAEYFTDVEESLGESTLEATGSPMLAAAAHSVPTAAMEALGLGLLRRPSQAAQSAAKAQRRVKTNPEMTPEDIARETLVPEERSWQEITEAVKRGQRKDVAEQVRPDTEILAQAEELGVDLNPSHYSTNEAYKRVEQAVTKSRDSELAAREARAIRDLGERADELITEFGGSTDKSLLETNIRTRMDDTIKDLSEKARNEYRQVKELIPPATKVNAQASKAYLDQRLADMGGDISGLSDAERQLWSVLDSDRPPTYARFDQLRRDIGAGYARQGPFKDVDSANLDAVYRALSIDQQGVADAMGAGKHYAAGRKLVSTRKTIEDQAQKMFGRELQQSIVPKLTSATTALTKGDVQRFRNLFNAMPPDMRQTAAMTALNDVFTAGSRGGGSLGQGFANAYEGLSRNAGAKAELFKHLPKEAQQRFDAIGKVSTGIYRAKALENTSRTAVAILQALESGGLVARVMDQATDRALNVGAVTPGLRGTAAGATVAKRALKETFDKRQAADKLLSSNEFNRAMNVAMEGRVKEAEVMLRRSSTWQTFRNTLGEGTKAQLAAVGPIAWLTQQDQQQQEPQAGEQ